LILAAVAGCLTLASRAAFLPFNPDWGPTVTEHCHVLSSPAIYAARVDADGDDSLPYWIVNPEQMVLHYHGGSSCISYAVGFLADRLRTRTLLPLKVVGLACTLVYAVLVALTLAFVGGTGRDRGLVWAPIFLAAFPPVFFLWVTLLPLGHYYESHLFYGLFVPVGLLAWSGRTNPPAALAVGLLGGLALFYSLSNAIFVCAVLLMLWLSHHQRTMPKLVQTGCLLGSSAVVLLVSGRLQRGLGRILDSLTRLVPGAGGDIPQLEVVPIPRNDLLLMHLSLLFGRHGQGTENLSEDLATQLLIAASGVIAVASAAFLLLFLVRASIPASRRRLGLKGTFLAANGFLLCAFVAAYLLIDPYTHHGGAARIEYLVPIFPPLFVGLGALLDRGLTVLGPAWKTIVVALAVGCGAVQLHGWTMEVVDNARPLERPEVGACDASQLHGYFWEVPEDSEVAPRDLERTDMFDRDAGERRCRLAHPGEGDACAFTGYALEAMILAGEDSCVGTPGVRQDLCVRAHGSVEWAAEVCGDPGGVLPTGCDLLDEPQRAACVSGAYQGNALDGSTGRCSGAIAQLCDRTFADPAERSSCLEQAVALLIGMPILPAPPQTVPARCLPWPGPWQGLCARAASLANSRPPAGAEASCEEVYLERYADDLPEEQGLAYDQCLFDAPPFYPFCAIGLHRLRGEIDCRWTGEFEP